MNLGDALAHGIEGVVVDPRDLPFGPGVAICYSPVAVQRNRNQPRPSTDSRVARIELPAALALDATSTGRGTAASDRMVDLSVARGSLREPEPARTPGAHADLYDALAARAPLGDLPAALRGDRFARRPLVVAGAAPNDLDLAHQNGGIRRQHVLRARPLAFGT